jgi:splicing factor 3B subunit 1
MDAPTPLSQTPGGFSIQSTPSRDSYGLPAEATEAGADLPAIKPEDLQYFGKLLEGDDTDLSALTKEEMNERAIMKLLLKVKSGTAPQRKTALRELRDNARTLGADAIFSQILPLLMSPSLEDQERHLLVKCIDRVLYKLGELVRPYVHKILVVIEPLLIDEDFYARAEGREIISNLAKAAGLATMIATMRPDIDNPDEYVRNTTARAFAVVASALGINTLLPFLRAVCQSKKSWQARHTGVKIVQQVAVLMGCSVLPYLKHLVMMCAGGLNDEQQKVRTITALCMAALAEAAAPYGIEAFDDVLRPLWLGCKQHRGKTLAAFLKAIGYIIPLMDENYANYYTKEVMPILIRQFDTADEDMKKIVLKCVMQCVATDGVEPGYVRETVLPDFFRCFWIRRVALDRRSNKQVVETTVSMANKVGCAEILSRIVDDLKDDSEPYRRMVGDCMDKVVTNLGAADVDERLEERLLDGLLYAFQEQGSEETGPLLSAFSTVVKALGIRTKPYLPQISGTIKWRLNNKEPHVRMQAADLIAEIAGVMKECGEEQLMGHLGVVLYEYLGEEYPEVLGSIIKALLAIVTVIGMTQMTPPIKDLLPRLTPILKNRHDKVQEACIDLVGRVADRGAEFVAAKEWMRISVELLEMLKAPKKSIRRAAVKTFGYIAKAIGPQDVLHTLLNNLKVQERQMRVCTTVAIAIVAETCGPFTVLPALMNEYRLPDMNVQNGVLKAMSFMFEYIGPMNKDYCYAVAPLLEHALMDKDHVHRQTACTAVKHVALGVAGMGCEDVLLHLLNYVFPNVLEESPHVINACMDAFEGLMVGLGAQRMLLYLLHGLWHPARFVREIYWKMYNSLYIYSPESLVAAYPRIPNDSVSDSGAAVATNTYARSHLDLMI